MGANISGVGEIAGINNNLTDTGSSYTQYPNSVVPDKTIKKGYDVFNSSAYNNLIQASKLYEAGDAKAKRCGRVNKRANEIYTTDGKLHMGDDRYIDCGITCNNCDMWPYQSDAPIGPVVGVKSPIGVKTTISGGNNNNSANPKDFTCYNKNEFKNTIGWNTGDYIGTQWNPKVPDEVATGCSGGSSKGRGSYVNTSNGFKIQNNFKNDTGTSEGCWLGTDTVKTPNKTFCYQSEVDWPTFCQLGDNLYSDSTCKTNCNVKEGSTPSDKKYCDYAYERLCAKKKGDQLKRDPDTDKILYSDRDWIRTATCDSYCGSASSPNCKSIKTDICTRNASEWESLSWLPNYCQNFWKNNIDTSNMNKACKNELLKEGGSQNIWSGKGCGVMCMGDGTDVDTDWCNGLKAEYCRKNDTNMLTDQCYEFCAGHPDLCDDYLAGEKGMCSRLNIKTQEDLQKEVPGTKRQYSDWCGCMMNTDFYEAYAADIDKKFNELGYSILGQIDLSPECMYPQCKQGSILSNSQTQRVKDGFCKDCAQIMLQNLSGSFVNNDIASSQSANCGNIKQTLLLKGIYKVGDKYIRVFEDGKYCTYPSKTSMEKDKEKNGLGEPSVVDKILDGNVSDGKCNLDKGYYYVQSIDKYIQVNSDSTYCVYASLDDFNKESVEPVTITNIPYMNDRTTDNDGVCVAPLVPVVRLPDITSTVPIEVDGKILNNEESYGFIFGIIFGSFFIIVIIISIIFYYKHKKEFS